MTIEPGQFVTLLGASGSGKTTLLRIVAGLTQLTAGQVVLDGKDISRVPVHKRDLGLVFQSYALFPHMSVWKNVHFPLAMRKSPRSERGKLIADALDAVHLTGFEHRYPRELSGGQQQRVALARAIVSRPRLLLLDEPLGALDRRLRESVQLEIASLSRDLGLTVINVTHDQEEALVMSDRIALLKDGRLVQYGTPEDLYLRPATDVVAGFLGEANVFRGPVTRDGGNWRLDCAEGHVIASATSATGRLWDAARSSAVVMVRPWAIRMSPLRESTQLDRTAVSFDRSAVSVVEGEVTSIIYVGDARRVLVRTRNGQELKVRYEMDEPVPASVGEPVALWWDAEASVLTRES